MTGRSRLLGGKKLDASRFAKPETIIERRVFVSFGHVDLGELLLGVLKPVEGLHLAQRCTQRVAVEFCAHPVSANEVVESHRSCLNRELTGAFLLLRRGTDLALDDPVDQTVQSRPKTVKGVADGKTDVVRDRFVLPEDEHGHAWIWRLLLDNFEGFTRTEVIAQRHQSLMVICGMSQLRPPRTLLVIARASSPRVPHRLG